MSLSRDDYMLAILPPGGMADVVHELEHMVFKAQDMIRYYLAKADESGATDSEMVEYYAKRRDDARVALAALYQRIER